MESNSSEPVAAAAAYNLVISDESMSAESNAATADPRVQELADKDHIPLVSTTLRTIPTSPSMENVLLDTLPMDESIDLGSESVLDQSVASESRLGEEASQGTEESGVKTNEIISAKEPLRTDGMGKDDVYFDDIVAPSGEMENEQFTEDSLGGNNETLVILGATGNDDLSQQVTEASSEFERIVRVSEERSFEPDTAHEVEFVEEKGLQAAESSRSLCKFFDNEDNAGGTDVEGKSFFDSFTTGDEDPIKPSPKVLEPMPVLPPLAMPHVSLSSSLSSAGATPSPVHRLSDPSSPFFAPHRNSASEGSVSESDPFSAGMFTIDEDRRHDAWIPSESTRLILVSVLTNAPGVPLLTHHTCSPHVIFEESLVCGLFILCESFDNNEEICCHFCSIIKNLYCSLMRKRHMFRVTLC